MRSYLTFPLLALTGVVAALVLGNHFMTVAPPELTRGIPARATCDGLGLDELLFPRGLVAPLNPAADEAVRRTPLPYVAAMREPSLSCGAVQGNVFRLMQFDRTGAPTIVRIVRLPDGGAVTAWVSQLEAPWWKGPGRLLVRETKALAAADWDRLQQAVSAARFWELPPFEPWEGEDGSDWLIEARMGWSYHVVVRVPERGAFRDLGELMLSLVRPPLPGPTMPR